MMYVLTTNLSKFTSINRLRTLDSQVIKYRQFNKILEITKNPNVDAKELNNVISLDPVLTGKVLKLINSAYYSLPNQITSIVRAIVMLGINTVKNLTQPEIMSLTNNALKAFQEEPVTDKNISMLALLRDLSDPQVRRGLARLLNLVKVIADQPENQNN